MSNVKHMTLGIPRKRPAYVTGNQWNSYGNNHWPIKKTLYKMGKNRGTSWLFPSRRPARKIETQKDAADDSEDTALLIICTEKRIYLKTVAPMEYLLLAAEFYPDN
ncbi:hypothetical protein ILYODFUR_028035 [Ilyodon furcidens]|uniref:Uncharacterized protein n=1 Tax=Ilyodon furcidens TaxID=33524 RepID=A0ABV0T2H8_9TELE